MRVMEIAVNQIALISYIFGRFLFFQKNISQFKKEMNYEQYKSPD